MDPRKHILCLRTLMSWLMRCYNYVAVLCLMPAYQNAPFKCKAAILLYVLDYPGIGKVMSVIGSGGFQEFMFYDIQGTHNKDMKKAVYAQNRRFQEDDSDMRKEKTKYEYTLALCFE